MPRKLLLLFLLIIPLSLQAQSPNEELQDFNVERNRISRTGMSMLGGWGAANFVGSGTAYFLSEGEAKYFHQMNALWNIANLSIAIPGYLGSKDPDKGLGPIETLEAQAGHERIFLFNAGLDVGYIMGGFFLRELSHRYPEHSARMTGYGNSFILQGGFLLAFDIVMYAVHKKHHQEKLSPILEHVELGATGIRLKWPLGNSAKP